MATTIKKTTKKTTTAAAPAPAPAPLILVPPPSATTAPVAPAEPTAADLAAELPMNTAAVKILKRSVCLVLTFTTLGNSRKVSLNDVELSRDDKKIEVDKEYVRATKTLLDTKELTKPISVGESAKTWLRTRAHAGHRVFGDGTYLVPMTMVKEVRAYLEKAREELRTAVDELCKRYPAAVEKQKERLKDLFHEGDYLSVDEVRNAFQLKWSFVSFAAPDELESVDRVAYEEAVQDHEARLSSAYDEVVDGLRAAGLKVMKDLVERLTPGKDGKKKAIHPTALRDLKEFCETLPKRNITDDAALAKVMTDINAALGEFDVEDIRGSAKVRERVLAAAEEATAKLGDLVISGGRRAVAVGGLPSAKS